MARMDRFELMGVLGFVSMFMGRRKKKKMKRLADALGTAVALYDDARPVVKKATDGDVLTTVEQEIFNDAMAAMGELVNSIEAF